MKERILENLSDLRKILRSIQSEYELSSLTDSVFSAIRETVNISVVGTQNSGKSRLINTILGVKIVPESTIPNRIDVQISPNTNEKDYFFYNNTDKQEISKIKEIFHEKENEPIKLDLLINNKWILEKNVTIKEKHDIEGLANLSEFDKINFFINSDVVILVIDSLMPITKSDRLFLEICSEYNAPTLIVLSKLDKTMEEERSKIIEYVKQHLEKINKNNFLLLSSDNLDSYFSREKIISTLNDDFLNKHYSHKRMNMIDSLFLYVYSSAKEKIINKLDYRNKATEKINNESIKKIEDINAFELEWENIEIVLVEKRQNIEKKLRSLLLQNKNKIFQKLIYDLDHINDIKSWWEKDLKYILERETQNVLYFISQGINRDVGKEIVWLQNEIDRLFNFKISSSPRFEIIVEEPIISQKEIQLSDNKKLKIFTRIGTAATVVAAGTLLMTSGIVGAAIAITTVGGITADYVLNLNNKKNKEKVKLELSQIVEKYLLDYTLTFSRDLKETFDQIIIELNLYRSNWKSNKSDEILKMKHHQISSLKDGVDWEDSLKQIELKIQEFTVEQSTD